MVTFPLRTTLHRNEKGLYTRIRVTDEDIGYGKIFLPDRSCKGLHEGIVEITSLNDKGNYGFFVGKMIKVQAPSDEEVSRYISDEFLHNGRVYFCESNLLGSYVIVEGVGGRKIVIRGKNGKAVLESDFLWKFVDSDCHEVKEKINAADLLCQGYQGCNFEDLVSKFTPYKFGYFHEASNDYTTFISDLFDDAVDCKFITLKVDRGVTFVEISRSNLILALDKFDRDEMTEIISQVGKINEEANKRMANKIKKGLVSPDSVKKGRRRSSDLV